MDSCYLPVPAANVTNFTVAYNVFDRNREHAIKIGEIRGICPPRSHYTFPPVMFNVAGNAPLPFNVKPLSRQTLLSAALYPE